LTGHGNRTSSQARRSLSALAVLFTAALFAPAAQAGPLVASDPDCAPEGLTQPFLPWLDVAQYQLAPSGTFESGTAGWALEGRASVAAGNEPFFVHGKDEKTSLSLPAGSAATTPIVCVGIEHPTIRFFARSSGGAAVSSLKVEVLFEDATGAVRSAQIGAAAGGDWAPTSVMPIVVNLLPLLPGDHTPVQFRVTPQGDADWSIDDFYVDPMRKS
jgi:hypothetical protein